MLLIHPDEHPVVGPALRPRPRGDARRGGHRRRRRRRPDRPQHGLSGAEGRARPGPGRRCCAIPISPCGVAARRDRGLGPAGDREAALGARARRSLAASSWRCASSMRPGSRRSPFTRGRRRVHHPGRPDYALAAELACAARRVPVIVSGGLRDGRCGPSRLLGVGRRRGDDRPRRARQPLDLRAADRRAAPSRRPVPRSSPSCAGSSIVARSTGERSAPSRNLRKFYPWYLEQLGITGPGADAYQRTDSLDEVRAMLDRAPVEASFSASRASL